MEAKEKAQILVNMFKPYVYPYSGSDFMIVAESEYTKIYYAKICAIAAVEHEYRQLREQLFNIRSCKVIEYENVYLTRLQSLINEEAQIKQEIENL